MGKPEGDLWDDPGLYSITVPYHDLNDFFFSGHVGTCMLITLEYRAQRWYKLSYFTSFILINQWIMLTLVRTHYCIDLFAGIIIAHYCFLGAEKVVYFFDVKILGLPGKKRKRLFFKPCKNCGWSNKCASDYMTNAEQEKLKMFYREQKALL